MKRLLIFCSVAALAFTFSVDAQSCKGSETVIACWEKFIPPLKAAEKKAAAEKKTDQAENAAATAATGVTNLASPAESSLKDFLSLIAASFESATSSENGDAFTFDWNPDVTLAGPNLGLKLQGVFAETKLHADVAKRLADNADALQKLEGTLEFGDDALLSTSLQPQTAGLGRSIEPHRASFQEMLFAVQDDKAAADDEIELVMEALDILSADQPLDGDGKGNRLTDQARIDARVAIVEKAAREFKAERDKISDFAKAFAKLLNNQPQFYGTAGFHARRNVIGPNEWAGKLTYEFAANNLNAFIRKEPTCASVKSSNAEDCATKLQQFASNPRRGIERLSLSLEYHRVNRRWIADTAAGLDLGFPHSRSFVGSLSFGANTQGIIPGMGDAAAGDVGEAHIDFTAKYELPEKDDSETKGFVASLTYTQKLAGGMSMPISLVYSDHASDLLNVDKKFSARFGIMYKMKKK